MFSFSRKWRLHHHTDPDNTPIHQYSPFGWHYLNPGGIDRPRLHNRNFGRLWHSHAITARRTFRLDVMAFLHPVLQFALQPFLTTVSDVLDGKSTTVNPSDIIEHYKKIKSVLPQRQRDTLFAAVVNICREKENFAEVKKLWEADCHDQYVSPWQDGRILDLSALPKSEVLEPDYSNIIALTTYCKNLPDTTSATSFPDSSSESLEKLHLHVPPLPLCKALLHSASVAGDAIWKDIFTMSLKKSWNTSPHYPGSIWSQVLRVAGQSSDERAVIEILKEILACNVLFQTIEAEDYVIAINVIRSDELYSELKMLLAYFTAATITRIRHRYVELRNAEKIPLNDKVFYHVHWSFQTRKPMQFLPRRLYFDYKPSTSKTESVSQKKKVKDVLQQRIELWKKDGTLPSSYSADSLSVDDAKEKTIERFKKSPWKKRFYSHGQTQQ